MSTAAAKKVLSAFPGALSNANLLKGVSTLLPSTFTTDKTLVCVSLCADEVNRTLEEDLTTSFKSPVFGMGGLAGVPFTGKTGWGAMASHIPDCGCCLLVYGPHVGVDGNGVVGSLHRRGMHAPGACCGSAMAAANAVMSGNTHPHSEEDAQQAAVTALMQPFGDRLKAAAEPMEELPMVAYEFIDERIGKVVDPASSPGGLAMLGGIQINTPEDTPDYFLPLKFHVTGADGATTDMLADLLASE